MEPPKSLENETLRLCSGAGLNKDTLRSYGILRSRVGEFTSELLPVIVTPRDLSREFSHENSGYFLELHPVIVALRSPGTVG